MRDIYLIGERGNYMEPKDMVKALREEMQLNRREFCDYFSIPYRTVQDWECGKRVMPDYVLRLLEYKIRMDQMLQDKNSKQEKKVQKKADKKAKDCTEKDFSICNMRQKDYKEVHALWLSCDGIGLNEIDDSESGIARFLLRNPETCFVARIDGKVVGAILTGQDGRRGYIYHLAVAEQCRGKGIAKELVCCAVHALEGLGIQKAALVVFSNNEDGNQFWEQVGFTVREDLTYRNRMVKNE